MLSSLGRWKLISCTNLISMQSTKRIKKRTIWCTITKYSSLANLGDLIDQRCVRLILLLTNSLDLASSRCVVQPRSISSSPSSISPTRSAMADPLGRSAMAECMILLPWPCHTPTAWGPWQWGLRRACSTVPCYCRERRGWRGWWWGREMRRPRVRVSAVVGKWFWQILRVTIGGWKWWWL